ncbi:decaprenyl-phosphate phosphoribosyltransferase [Candidatus Woesebacteria bacterium]|nr:decaprenyl-phosphate phosphoribosyltransferase [Candidatus Woesebacteria bacterium]
MANISSETKPLIPGFIRIGRPIHWVKNLSIFAALIFTGNLFDSQVFFRVFIAFLVFNLITSATYIINDIIDANNDRQHPIKKFRPIASGEVPIPMAVVETVVISAIALFAAREINQLFFLLVGGYLVLQILYSLYLKNLVIIDILIIASGFIIRVYSGAFVIDAHLSVWFLLCVISVALFLASGKRRAELNLLKPTKGLTRKILGKYKRELLTSYVTMFGNAAWMSWALFTFFESPRATLPVWLFLAELSKATTINKLLMITIPIVIFGIMRYENIIFEGRAEAPEKVLLSDIPLITSVALWVGIVIWILYGGVANI